MQYKIFKMNFLSKVHLGIKSLEDSYKILHSDTLFSALFIECMKLYGIEVAEIFKDEFEKGAIKISSAFPYIYDIEEEETRLYIPKPIIYINSKEQNRENTINPKKVIKKIQYIRTSRFDEYLEDNRNAKFDNMEENYLEDVCFNVLETKSKIAEKTEPFNITSISFNDKLDSKIDVESGLYFILEYSKEENLNLIKTLMKSLSYTGVGGKKSIGYGQFKYTEENLEDEKDYIVLLELIKKAKGSPNKMLLSLLSPSVKDMTNLDEKNIFYSLIRRGGFVYSNTYAENNMKKKEVFMFEEGSCMDKTYTGEIKNLKENGNHNVYRYGIPMYIGVDVNNE